MVLTDAEIEAFLTKRFGPNNYANRRYFRDMEQLILEKLRRHDMEHTHGKLIVGNRTSDGGAVLISMEGPVIAETTKWTGPGSSDPEMREANARRLAACWNACNGIKTSSLERMTEGVYSLPLLLEQIAAGGTMLESYRNCVREWFTEAD